MSFSNQPITVTAAAFTVLPEQADSLIVLNVASGVAVTLPASSGSGRTFKFLVGTTISSLTSTIKVANSTDTFAGVIGTHIATGATGASFWEAATGTDDTITMSGTTTGGIRGSYIELTDIASGLWFVKGDLIGSGVLASTLSATVP